MLSRRHLLATGSLAAAAALLPRCATAITDLAPAFAALEKSNGGRLGVLVVDTGSGARTGYRADERFPMCSTFKFLLAAFVLNRVDAGKASLGELLHVPPAPLLSNSPLTEPHAGATMTIADTCFAALTRSDNTAANMLLDRTGGPAALTAYVRTLHDPLTRLDRNEPTLNSALPGDPRDTTTPAAMAGNLQAVLLGNALRAPSREQLTRWMESNVTGLERLRADLPAGWRAADKTGSNGEHTSNDIAVLWPAGRPPILVTAYVTGCTGPESKRAALLREVGRLARTTV